jgi:hypothetical protein
MKKVFGVVVLGLLFSVPANAQGRGGFGGSAAGSNSGGLTFGGGAAGGGAVGGQSRANIPDYGRAVFATAAYSGGEGNFAPSSFLSFEQAVEVGKLESEGRKSVAEAAAENQAAKKAKSRVEFVQDSVGNVVSLSR